MALHLYPYSSHYNGSPASNLNGRSTEFHMCYAVNQASNDTKQNIHIYRLRPNSLPLTTVSQKGVKYFTR